MDEQNTQSQTSQQTTDSAQQAAPQATPDVTGVERNRLVAALSYIGILVIIPLFFVDKDDPFVKFHARQGLVILIGFIIVNFVPIVGQLLSLVLALASIAGLIMSLQGKLWKIPLIGDLAEKFKF